MQCRRHGLVELWSVPLLLLVLSANASAQSTGSIAGLVTDETGAVMPGVAVDARSPALIEQVRSVVTDDAGRYRIEALRVGIYTVTFQLAGFSPYVREGIELTTGFTATVNAKLVVGALEETVTVSGASPLVDVQNAGSQANLSREVIDTLPTGGKTWAGYAALTVGLTAVTRGDVGGTLGDRREFVTMHGSRREDGSAQFDGMSIGNTAGTTGGSSKHLVVNQAAVQEVVISTGGISAEVESGGVAVNAVPREGGDRFTFWSNLSGTTGDLQSSNVDDELRQRGALQAAPLGKVFDYQFAAGGPIIRKRLWFFTPHRWSGVQEYGTNVYYNKFPGTFKVEPDLDRPGLADVHTRDNSVRLTWQASTKHKFAISHSQQSICQCNNFVTISAGTVSAEADYDYWTTPAHNFQTTWTYPATSRLLIEAGFSDVNSNIKPRMQPEISADGVTTDAIAFLETSTGTWYNLRAPDLGAAQLADVLEYNQVNGRFSVSYITGTHAIKAGLTAYHGIENNINVNVPGDVTYQFSRGVPAGLRQYASPHTDRNTLKLNLGLFAQDQWTIDRATINLGLRFDYLNGEVPAYTRPGGRFVAPLTVDPISNVPNWTDLAPRVGIAYDLKGNGKTALKATLGRYVVSSGTNIARLVNPSRAMVLLADRTWGDANQNFVPDCDLHNIFQNGECGDLSDRGFGTVRVAQRYDPRLLEGFGVREYNWQTSAAVQHELRPGWSVSVGYYRTSYGNFTVTDNLAVTPEDFNPYCITAPNNPPWPGGGSELCGLYDINPSKFGRSELLITSAEKFGERKEVYNGVDTTVRGRVGDRFQLGGGVGVGRTATDNCFVVDSPQQARPGFCNITPPWSAGTDIKFNGSYELPFDSQASWVLQNLPGIPRTASYSASNAEIAPSLGRNLAAGANGRATIDLLPLQSDFEARQTQLDLRFTKIFRVKEGRIRGWVDLYNILNANTILGVVGTYGPSWLRPSRVLPGRLLKFGTQIEF